MASLLSNGVSPAQAPGVGNKASEAIRAEPTKVLLVAVSAGVIYWALRHYGYMA